MIPRRIQAADHVVELGPGSGEKGGEVVFEGPPSELVKADTVTGLYLVGTEEPSPFPGSDGGWTAHG